MKALNLSQTVQLSTQMGTQIFSMMQRPKWSHERIQAYQLKRIKVILEKAQGVALYKNKLPKPQDIRSLKDMAELPILTKDDLVNAQPKDRICTDFSLDELIVSKSSGSTGKSLDVYYDVFSYNIFIIAGLRLYTMAFPYMPWHKQTYIYTSPYPLDSLFGMYPLNFISTLNPISDTIEKLRANPPDLLVCYPSHLRSIADQMKPEDFKKIMPKAINVNSEMSSQAERDYLGNIFNTFVFDDYSSEELTRIASQCKHLSYHIFDDINFMEVVDDKGNPVPEGTVGNLVGTNLHNIGQPLIRYKQGDRGAIRTKKCDCGRNFRILEKLEGRKNDAFVLSDGETISSGFLLDLTYGVFLDYPMAVQAFCLLQEAPDQWTLELVPGKNFSHFVQTKILEDLKKNLNRPKVSLVAKVVREVRKTATGKANPIISLVQKK
jgi:phenylacetate-CoA ligase